MPKLSQESLGSLFVRSRQALKITQEGLASAAAWSMRTQRRYETGRSTPPPERLVKLGRLVGPVDAELGAELIRRGEHRAKEVGLPLPKAPLPAASTDSSLALPGVPGAPPAEASPLTTQHRVDAIVCAATDQGELLPRAVRPILLAAFARAEELGMSVSEVRRALEPKKDVRSPKRAPAD